jgi:hypothetical protein
MTTETEKLADPWTIARDIASWLPDKDHERAKRIITNHENRHRAAERLQETQGAD